MKKFCIIAAILGTFLFNDIWITDAARDTIRVVQGTSLGPRVLPILIARDEKFFAFEGLAVEFILMPQAGPSIIAAGFTIGEIDYVLDNGGLLLALEKGVPMVFGNAIGRWPAHLIARPGHTLKNIEGKIILSHLVVTHGQIQGLKTILRKRGIKYPQIQHIYDPMVIIEMLKDPKHEGTYDFAFLTNRLIDAEEAGLNILIDYFNLDDVRISNYIVERKGINPRASKKFHNAFTQAVKFINNPVNKSRVLYYITKYGIEKNNVNAEKLYKSYLMPALVPGGLKISDEEFTEFAKFFGVEIPKGKIRQYYDPR